VNPDTKVADDHEADDMEARHAELFAAHDSDDVRDDAMSAFSKFADECRMAAETAEKDGKTEKAARLRKIEKETRERCARRGTHARKVLNTMNHLEMAEKCERMAKDHEEAGATKTPLPARRWRSIPARSTRR
jgi:hypothetical protein